EEEEGIGDWSVTGVQRCALPISVAMIDPRNRIREVGLDLWIGNPPGPGGGFRPPASADPPAAPGDLPRQKVALAYSAGEGRGDKIGRASGREEGGVRAGARRCTR